MYTCRKRLRWYCFSPFVFARIIISYVRTIKEESYKSRTWRKKGEHKHKMWTDRRNRYVVHDVWVRQCSGKERNEMENKRYCVYALGCLAPPVLCFSEGIGYRALTQNVWLVFTSVGVVAQTYIAGVRHSPFLCRSPHAVPLVRLPRSRHFPYSLEYLVICSTFLLPALHEGFFSSISILAHQVAVRVWSTVPFLGRDAIFCDALPCVYECTRVFPLKYCALFYFFFFGDPSWDMFCDALVCVYGCTRLFPLKYWTLYLFFWWCFI